MAKKYSITFSDWKMLFVSAFKAFPSLWWRIASVNAFAVLVLLLGTAIFAGIGYIAFRGMIEDFVANVMYGGSILAFIPLILLLAVWVLFVIVFSLNGKTGNFLTVKNYLAKKKRSPFSIYFVDAWAYFWRYLSLVFRSLWYILWPVAIVWGAVLLFERFIGVIPEVSLGGVLVGVLLLIWRVVHLAFVRETLIQFNSTTERTFSLALKLSKGNWWGILIFLLSFFLLINLVRVIFILPEKILASPEWLVIVAGLLDFLFSFFVLAPLFIAYLYFLMLHLSKQKSVK